MSPNEGESQTQRQTSGDASVATLVGSLSSQLELLTGSTDRVRSLCAKIGENLERPPSEDDLGQLQVLAHSLRTKTGTRVTPVADLLETVVATCPVPWTFLAEMLRARDKKVSRRALEQASAHAASGAMPVELPVVELFAEQLETEEGPFSDRQSLEAIAGIVRRMPAPMGGDPVKALLLDSTNQHLSRLAARLLDLNDEPAPEGLARRMLGTEAYEYLASYLAFTRAGHNDLLHLSGPALGESPVVEALRQVEEVRGEELLRQVIAELGWPRMALGIEVRPMAGVCIAGSIPFTVSPWEVSLLKSCSDQVRCSGEWMLFIAHGGLAAEERGGVDFSGPVARFRGLNLLHSELLEAMLDVAPLTIDRVDRLVAGMDQVVEDFMVLFATHSDECALLPDVYGGLRREILDGLEAEVGGPSISPEVTRLTTSFEEPANLGEVRTLHGLKRYLHQKGLALGSRLAGVQSGPQRTIDLVLARRDGLHTIRRIRYTDFESGNAGPQSGSSVPYSVRVAIEGFARQFIAGRRHFPDLEVFCYGNEVHYYLAFRNHPAFIRVDFSPPLRGGMVDLEFFGVSAYELNQHPAINLEAISVFLREIGFEVTLDDTHVHARCDKDSVLGLGALCERADALLRLAPYFMDLDWTIGSLDLNEAARSKLIRSWAASFKRWGELPLDRLLTRDHVGVLVGVETGLAGEQEVAWSGEGACLDRFSTPLPPGFLSRLQVTLRDLGVDGPPLLEDDADRMMGQIQLEDSFLGPLRAAVARGQLVVAPAGYRSCSFDVFAVEHEVERFAEILSSGYQVVAPLVAVARVAVSLERILDFRTTGHVAGRKVQRTRLALLGDEIEIYVLRDDQDIIRLALYSHGDTLWRDRESVDAPWRSNACSDAIELATLLRTNGYLAPGAEVKVPETRAEARDILREIAEGSSPHEPGPLPGERMLTGLQASPGRVVGPAVFGTEGRRPEELEGVVLVSPSVSPDDTTFLYHAAGIVSTGGGVLSHAGLIAIQFHKPALIVSGRWRVEDDGASTLLYKVPEYHEKERVVGGLPVCIRDRLREREHVLREGDLVILNATQGTLQVLGQDRDALALHDGLRHLGKAIHRLGHATGDQEVLALRGRRIRARHQLEKLLTQLADPVPARWVVHELLLGGLVPSTGSSHADRELLLQVLLHNRRLEGVCRVFAERTSAELERRLAKTIATAERSIKNADFLFEVLGPRLDALRIRDSFEEAVACIGPRPASSTAASTPIDHIDALTRNSLQRLRKNLSAEVTTSDGDEPHFRHKVRQFERIDAVLGVKSQDRQEGVRAAERLADRDAATCRRLERRLVLGALDGGLELFSLIGSKAANLAEIGRLIGPDLVPPWFVVTDRAFRLALAQAPGARSLVTAGLNSQPSTLREAIDAVLARRDLSNFEKSTHIRALWEGVELPDVLVTEVLEAYRGLAAADIDEAPAESKDGPFVALRSSSREEDTEIAAGAGEFDTFLFVSGSSSLIEYLKRTWSGLWTERAIHNRAVAGTIDAEGGGVVIQRIVWSRVSGVLLTINVGKGELQEIQINAGLGLGEGIVSGIVAADQITVSKEGDLSSGDLRFTYVTADKQERVVFNRRAGAGTVRTETLYHQRLRPALEYVELCELVRVASRLEAAYGYPLDIEFALEGSRLWILQARPVVTFLAVFQETLERRPLEVQT
ncbi:MAG: hypothetical protein K8R59_14655 [Thermoanaerobaculales bacterium]|nr:hypothetical protein [Thermoanaerobaculales bacterium]